MTCPQCQLPNPVGTSYCARCGAALQGAPGGPMAGMVAGAGERKGMATTALVLGILSPLLACVGIGFLTAIVALILGIVAMVKAGKEPGVYGGKGAAIAGTVLGGFTLVLVLPMMAAIAIPSLLRARVSANESSAIGDIRTVISGEAAYQSANAGFYDTLACLGAPSTCIPGYSGPVFVDAVLASGADKSGYKRTFHPGAPASAPAGADQRSPSSIESFAYTVVPVQRNQSGVRGFCGDSSGRICITMDGSEPPVVNGECSQTCQMLN
jgi:hypothetical protein